MGGSEARTADERALHGRSCCRVAGTSEAAAEPQVLNCCTLRPTAASVSQASYTFLDSTYVTSPQQHVGENRENALANRFHTLKSLHCVRVCATINS